MKWNSIMTQKATEWKKGNAKRTGPAHFLSPMNLQTFCPLAALGSHTLSQSPQNPRLKVIVRVRFAIDFQGTHTASQKSQAKLHGQTSH